MPELRIGRANLCPVVRFLWGYLVLHLCEYLFLSPGWLNLVV